MTTSGAAAVPTVSRSAVWALAARVIGARDPDPAVRNADYLAERFLGSWERALLEGSPLGTHLDVPYEEALRDAETSAAVRYLMQRTAFVDAHLRAAMAAGVSQVVVLGAGFDTRAYRVDALRERGHVFEVDSAATQTYKKACVEAVVGRLPDHVSYVAADLKTDDLFAVLAAGGYRPQERAFFVWEGVTMYLPESGVRRTLSAIAQRAGEGSAVAFDYWTHAHVEEWPRIDERARRRRALLEAWGEPVRFGFPDDEEAEFVAGTGLRLDDRVAAFSEAAVARFLSRGDGSRVGNTPWPPPAPPLGRYGIWLALAVKPGR